MVTTYIQSTATRMVHVELYQICSRHECQSCLWYSCLCILVSLDRKRYCREVKLSPSCGRWLPGRQTRYNPLSSVRADVCDPGKLSSADVNPPNWRSPDHLPVKYLVSAVSSPLPGYNRWSLLPVIMQAGSPVQPKIRARVSISCPSIRGGVRVCTDV